MITRIRSPFSTLDQQFDELWQLMFHTFPTESKPPLVVDVYGDEPSDDSDSISNAGIMIQMAVAGYTEEQLKVYSKSNSLIIEGDNTLNSLIPSKFQSRFKRIFPCKETVDLDNTSVNLENGILTVRVPFHQPKEDQVKTFF